MTASGFPAGDVIGAALVAAVRAPSPHNCQPWRFVTGPDRIGVLLDRQRLLAVADPDGREARIACGAAILNMRVAIRAAGRAVVVDLLPDRGRPDHLATVWVKGGRPVAPSEVGLAEAVARRHSNRRPFTDQQVPAGVRAELVRAARVEGAELVLVERSTDLDKLARLVRRAEVAQSSDPGFQAEVRRWTTDDVRDEGVPAVAGGPHPAEGSLLALRPFGAASGPERAYEREPLVAVLTSRADTVAAQLTSGQALQRVLLTATVAGLSASFLSQPVELPAARAELRALLGGGSAYPQVVLRLGYGYPAPATGRRAVEAVLDPAIEAVTE